MYKIWPNSIKKAVRTDSFLSNLCLSHIYSSIIFAKISVERRRRYNINDRIKELGTLLPKEDDRCVFKFKQLCIVFPKQFSQLFRHCEGREAEQGLNSEGFRGVYQEAESGPGQKKVSGGEVATSRIPKQKTTPEVTGTERNIQNSMLKVQTSFASMVFQTV